MQDIQIWHNQSCSKSRNAVSFLESHKIDVVVRNYLENPPSKDELKDILKKLNIKANELLRKNEELYLALNLEDEKDEDRIIDVMVKNPILIERPIVIKNNSAVIARPIEKLDELLAFK